MNFDLNNSIAYRATIKVGLLFLVSVSLAISLGFLIRLPLSVKAQTPSPGVSPQAALGTAFTYQGSLKRYNQPVSDICNFEFKLYDGSDSGARLIGGPVNRNGVTVADGYFTVSLDFGGNVFNGDTRYLGITVNCGDGAVTLSPRQAITPAPYALQATSAGHVPWSGLSGIPADLANGDDVGLTSVTWTDIQSRPLGLDDGDDTGQTVVTWTDIQSRPVGLDDGDDAGPTTITWTDIQSRPLGLDDGDNSITYTAGTGLALNANELTVVTSTIQQRVSGSCAVGFPLCHNE
jgi:hypothetical protein